MRITKQAVGYEAMVKFLSKTFGTTEPITINKANGHLNIVGGWSESGLGVFPVLETSYMSMMVRPDGQLEFPLPEGVFLITTDDESSTDTVLVDTREAMDTFVVSGNASEAVLQGLGLQVQSSDSHAAA
jgi:hypothetical protein